MPSPTARPDTTAMPTRPPTRPNRHSQPGITATPRLISSQPSRNTDPQQPSRAQPAMPTPRNPRATAITSPQAANPGLTPTSTTTSGQAPARMPVPAARPNTAVARVPEQPKAITQPERRKTLNTQRRHRGQPANAEQHVVSESPPRQPQGRRRPGSCESAASNPPADDQDFDLEGFPCRNSTTSPSAMT